VLPAASLVLVIIAYPFVNAIWISFTNKTVAGPPPDFIGLQNYIKCIHRSDFWQTFLNTIVFASGTLILGLLFGLALGLALHRVKRGRDFVGAIILLPWIVPTVISTLVWLWMYNPFAGVLNYLFMNLGFANQPISWLGIPKLAMISVIIVSAWRNIPYFGVITLAGLKEIPEELYEVSEIDGANALQQLRFITLPALKGVLFIYSTLAFVQTAYDFALVYILTRGGPVGSTEILSVKSFMTAFVTGKMGLGVAIPVIAFPLFAPLVLLVTRRMISEWAGGAV
jgi:multiple sugar transport system permease protein